MIYFNLTNNNNLCWRPCLVRFFWCLNDLLQSLHLKFFSSVWHILWLFRLPVEAELKVHWWQLNGFSPVCALLACIVMWLFWMLEKSHCEHLWGFSPECVISCSLIFANVIEEYPHWLHWWGLTRVCVIMCLLRARVKINRFLHLTLKWTTI